MSARTFLKAADTPFSGWESYTVAGAGAMPVAAISIVSLGPGCAFEIDFGGVLVLNF